jgi:hypothetical protein
VVGHWEDTLLECIRAKVCPTGKRYRDGRIGRMRDSYLNWLRKGTGKFMARVSPSTGSKSGNSKKNSDVKCSDTQRVLRVLREKRTNLRLNYKSNFAEGLPSPCDHDILLLKKQIIASLLLF